MTSVMWQVASHRVTVRALHAMCWGTMTPRLLLASLAAAVIAGCASTPSSTTPDTTTGARPDAGFTADPYPSTYRRVMSPPVLLQGATVLTGTGSRLDSADVLMRDGRIVAVGTGIDAPADVTAETKLPRHQAGQVSIFSSYVELRVFGFMT